MTDFKFYTDEEAQKLSTDVRLAQKRAIKLMHISRLNHAVRVLAGRMGYDTENAVKTAELKGVINKNGLYDAFLVAVYERKAAKIRLGEMPFVPKIAEMIHLFFYEVQKEDPAFWREMRERASSRAARLNQDAENNREKGDNQ